MRDSSNQLQSYKSLLQNDQIARLFRGAINLQGRYMRQSPHCNAFQPPPESGIPPTLDSADGDVVSPPYDPDFVFECKYEIDSLAAFFQLSWYYYETTDDADFFRKFGWKDAVRAILDTAKDMKQGTYADDGRVLPSPYTWERKATSQVPRRLWPTAALVRRSTAKLVSCEASSGRRTIPTSTSTSFQAT